MRIKAEEGKSKSNQAATAANLAKKQEEAKLKKTDMKKKKI